MSGRQEADDASAPLLEEQGEKYADFDAFEHDVQACAAANPFVEDLWDKFEQADISALEYQRYGEEEDNMITSLLTFVTVTTFIGGFAVSDFGNFNAESWSNEDGNVNLSGIVFLTSMAFVAIHNLYLSVFGTLLAASYYRTRNQTGTWDDECARIVKVVSEGFKQRDGFKGRRKKILVDAVKTKFVIRPDYLNAFAICGRYAELDVMQLFTLDYSSWTLFFTSPHLGLSERAFDLLREWTFTLSIILYVVAQTLKAFQGASLKSVAFLTPVLLIVLFWMTRLVWDLRPVYTKLRD